MKRVLHWSLHTIGQYCMWARQLVSDTLPIHPETDYDSINTSDQIGGPGVEVQIDESAFGKRKYGRGKSIWSGKFILQRTFCGRQCSSCGTVWSAKLLIACVFTYEKQVTRWAPSGSSAESRFARRMVRERAVATLQW
jgi:hypothetical protein